MSRPPARPATPEEAYARDVVTVLGLPFDAVDTAGAVAALRSAAFEGRRCFVSTPNLNFAIAASRDEAFRRSVLRSDLSLADGMPIVALARAEGDALPERVAGSTVFEALAAHAGPPLDVYFFGGPPGAGEAAARRLNATATGLRCVGHEGAGFGPVETLGDAGTIARINASGAHFVVASLGAAKGQAWLLRHADALHAPLLCHLGAVLNFAAERLRRAPPWMQRAGLEWAWRIREEPALWRRYAGDAAAAVRLLAPRVLARAGHPSSASPAVLAVDRAEGATSLRLAGSWARTDLAALRAALVDAERRGGRVRIDLAAATALDARTIGLLQIAEGRLAPRGFAIGGASPRVAGAFERCLAGRTLRGAAWT
jgi:N-acetylglucosaminyldiphosphoundecaprenol N-acetyl-beta-D-mannosaminyltransferase